MEVACEPKKPFLLWLLLVMVLVTATEKQTNTETGTWNVKNLTMLHFGGSWKVFLRFRLEKSIEHIDLSVLFFGNLEDELVERHAFGGGLGCEAKTLSGSFV